MNWFRSPASALVCPRCEKPLDGHDATACARRMSRRFFFQTAGGAVAAVAVAQVLPEATGGLSIAAQYDGVKIRLMRDFDVLRQVFVSRIEVGHELKLVDTAHCSVTSSQSVPDIWRVPGEAVRWLRLHESLSKDSIRSVSWSETLLQREERAIGELAALKATRFRASA